MKRREKNENKMFTNVRDTMGGEAEAYQDVPALVEDQADLTAGIAKIEEENKKFQNAIKGRTKEMHNAIDASAASIVPIKSALSSLGYKNVDEHLIAITKIADHELNELDENEFKTTISTILEAARANEPVISVSHKITNEKIDAAQSLFDAAIQKSGIKGSSFNERKALRQNLTTDISYVRHLLSERYDKDIEIIHEDHLITYNKYKAARVIIDLGGSHGAADDGGNDAPPDSPAPPPAQ